MQIASAASTLERDIEGMGSTVGSKLVFVGHPFEVLGYARAVLRADCSNLRRFEYTGAGPFHSNWMLDKFVARHASWASLIPVTESEEICLSFDSLTPFFAVFVLSAMSNCV